MWVLPWMLSILLYLVRIREYNYMKTDYLKLEVKKTGAYFAVWHILYSNFFLFQERFIRQLFSLILTFSITTSPVIIASHASSRVLTSGVKGNSD